MFYDISILRPEGIEVQEQKCTKIIEKNILPVGHQTTLQIYLPGQLARVLTFFLESLK